MINAIGITPTGTNAGDSFMGYDAIYIMTGEQQFSFPRVTIIRADTTIKIPTYDITTDTFINPEDSTEN